MAVLRNALSLVLAASLALSGGGFAPAALASAPRAAGEAGPPLAVRIGQANGLTHIDFPGEAPGGVRIDGAVVELRFAHATLSPELARLKFAPTNLVKSAAATPDGGGLRLILTLADGVLVKSGRADGVFALSLWPKPGASAAGAADKDQAPAARPDPVPAGGRVRMQAETQGQTLILRFPWRAPLGAAVFRRGDALWLVFDAKAVIDLSALRGGRPQIGRIDAYQGGDYSAVRILAPPTVLAAPSAQGGVWTLALGPAAGPPPGAVKIGRDDQTGVAALTADVAGATGVFWVTDPAVGDRLAVVTALPPAKGSAIARNFVDATLLPSVQGLALSSAVDDLQVSTDGDVVRISRPKGLALSSDHAAPHAVAAGLGMPQPAPLPALVDFNGWSNLGGGGFIARYDQLQAAAGDEEAKGKAGGVGARLALARFLAGSELSFEALGVLDLAARGRPDFDGGRGVFAGFGARRAPWPGGRYKDAEADFSSPVLADDPASALWRGYVDDKLGDYAGARQQFAAGRRAMPLFAEKWRGPLRRSRRGGRPRGQRHRHRQERSGAGAKPEDRSSGRRAIETDPGPHPGGRGAGARRPAALRSGGERPLAEERAMLINVVDVPPLCNFILPAIVRTGPLAVAISTAGASPALAKRMKREISGPFRRALRRPRGDAQRRAWLGQGHAADLSGPQGILRVESSTAIPTRSTLLRSGEVASVQRADRRGTAVDFEPV